MKFSRIERNSDITYVMMPSVNSDECLKFLFFSLNIESDIFFIKNYFKFETFLCKD